MDADLTTMRARVLESIQASPVADNVAGVDLEAAWDNDGFDFVRVMIQIKDFSRTNDAALEALLERIEESVGEVDRRYPSVRFLDAA